MVVVIESLKVRAFVQFDRECEPALFLSTVGVTLDLFA